MISRCTTPCLTTVDYRLSQIMETSLEIMNGLMENAEQAGPRSVTIKPEPVVRKST